MSSDAPQSVKAVENDKQDKLVMQAKPVKKYTCTVCDKSYSSKRELRRHVKVHVPTQAVILPPSAAVVATINKPSKVKKDKKPRDPFKFTVTEWMTIN